VGCGVCSGGNKLSVWAERCVCVCVCGGLHHDGIWVNAGQLRFGEHFGVNFREGCTRSMKCNVEF
jgi:hypothetical protein